MRKVNSDRQSVLWPWASKIKKGPPSDLEVVSGYGSHGAPGVKPGDRPREKVPPSDLEVVSGYGSHGAPGVKPGDNRPGEKETKRLENPNATSQAH